MIIEKRNYRRYCDTQQRQYVTWESFSFTLNTRRQSRGQPKTNQMHQIILGSSDGDTTKYRLFPSSLIRNLPRPSPLPFILPEPPRERHHHQLHHQRCNERLLAILHDGPESCVFARVFIFYLDFAMFTYFYVSSSLYLMCSYCSDLPRSKLIGSWIGQFDEH